MKTQLYLSEIKLLVTGLLVFLCANSAVAQPGNLDQTFQARIERSGAVRQAAVQPDGKIVIVGEFGKFNEASRSHIARVNADGSLDGAFNPSTNASVKKVLLQPDGKILIFGDFTVVNGATRNYIARLNADGSLDGSFVFTHEPGVLPTILGLTLQPDGKILVCGVGGVGILRLNPDGSPDNSFNAPATAGHIIFTCVVQADGKIIIGGRWLGAVGNIARLNADGSLDSSYAVGGAEDDVYGIVLQPDGKAVVVGRFNFFGVLTGAPVRRRSIARLNAADGSVDQTFNAGENPPLIFDFNSAEIIVQPDGKIVFSGSNYNGEEKKIVRLFADGAPDGSFGADNYINGSVSTAVRLANGKIIVGGTFTRVARANGLTDLNYRNGLARLNADGYCDSSFNPGTGAVLTNSDSATAVQSIEVAADGRIYIAGKFNLVNGISRTYLARLNSDGSLDEGFNPVKYDREGFSAAPNSPPISLAIQPDGCLLTGASLNIDRFCNGQLDPDFSTVSNLLTYPLAIEVQPDGKIIVAGAGSGDITRLNPNGTADNSFAISETNGYIASVAVQPDGKIMVGGDFTTFNGNPRQRVARLNSNGSLDISFLAGTSANGTVNSIAVQPDGKILLAGAFTEVRGFVRRGIARVEADGEFDSSFNPGSGFEPAAVNSIVLQLDGKIIAGGNFTSFNGAAAKGVARINPNGALDAGFNAGDGAPAGASVNAIALHNGRAIIGGSFTGFNGQNKLRLARLQKSATRSQFDFDGDGRADVSVYRPAGGFWYLLNSANGFSAAQFGVSTDVIVPASYDADGKTDFAVFRPSTGTWYVQSSAFGFFAAQFGQNGDIPVPADYDNDGNADLAVFRPSNGTWYVQGSSIGFLAFQFGQNGDVPVTGDYDGDGRSDFAVFRPSDGTWYLQRSTQGFFAAQFGQNGDVPVPADYSGNGKTELAVWRPATSSFYIARTLTNSAQNFDAVQFGVSTDIPVPADYDGDGRADIAVFRSTDGFWYRLNSTNGQLQAVQFGISADKPIPAAFR